MNAAQVSQVRVTHYRGDDGSRVSQRVELNIHNCEGKKKHGSEVMTTKMRDAAVP